MPRRASCGTGKPLAAAARGQGKEQGTISLFLRFDCERPPAGLSNDPQCDTERDMCRLKKLNTSFGLFCVGAFLVTPALAQPVVPPTPVPAALVTTTGPIAQLNYGAEGEVKSFIVGRTIVEIRAGSLSLGNFQAGHVVTAEGYVQDLRNGFSRMNARRITNATLGVTLDHSVETPFNGTGQVRQYNYGLSGEVDGLLLANGDLVRTPRSLAATVVSLAPLGATVQIEGWARKTILGKTTIRATHLNGQLLQPAPGVAPPKPAPPKPAPAK